MRGLLTAVVFLGIAGAAAAWIASAPRPLSAADIEALPAGDATRGERIFFVGGCASCHAAAGAKGEDKLRLGGGRVLKTDFGDFVVPNISTDKTDGIGGWTLADFASAMRRGVSPDGRHYYPAFPYTSYIRMRPGDVADLWAFFQTLPPVAGRQPDHALRFPFNLRRGIGLWKLAFLSDAPAVALPDASPEVAAGQYLAEGPGHCGECHTARNFAGALDDALWLGGAKAAEGPGNVPNITTGPGGIGDWSVTDIAYFLESGFTPDYDSVGGSMVEVQENFAKATPEDRAAIAAYLAAVPPVASTK